MYESKDKRPALSKKAKTTSNSTRKTFGSSDWPDGTITQSNHLLARGPGVPWQFAASFAGPPETGAAPKPSYDELKLALNRNMFATSSKVPTYDHTDEARAAARQIADTITPEQALSDGTDLITSMLLLNEATAASTVLDQFIAAQVDLWRDRDNFPVNRTDDITRLQSATDMAAREGDHQLVAKLLRSIFMFAQVLSINLSLIRRQALFDANESRASNPSAKVDTQSLRLTVDADELYMWVYDYYPALERHALDKGDQAEASRVRLRAEALNLELTGQIFDNQVAYGEQLTLATEKVAFPDRKNKQQQRLGWQTIPDVDGGKAEILESMPNLPALEASPSYSGSLESHRKLIKSMQGRSELVAELYRFPTFQRKYEDHLPDMNQLDQRVEVWMTIMPDLSAMTDDPLTALIELMGRYLENFTTHSKFNIRDYGENYLTKDSPEDYYGRMIHDCGVYALTVAHELLRVSKAGGLDISTRLATTTDHCMLAIIDNRKDVAFILNNDKFTGPVPNNEDDINEEFGKAYGETFKHDYTFISMMTFEIGSSDEEGRLPSSKLKSTLWDRYQTATQWGFVPVEGQPEPTQEYYDHRKSYDRQQNELIDLVTQIHTKYVAPKDRSALPAGWEQAALADLSEALRLGTNILNMYAFNRLRAHGPGSLAIGKGMAKIGGKHVFTGADTQPSGIDQLHFLLQDMAQLQVKPDLAAFDSLRTKTRTDAF